MAAAATATAAAASPLLRRSLQPSIAIVGLCSDVVFVCIRVEEFISATVTFRSAPLLVLAVSSNFLLHAGQHMEHVVRTQNNQLRIGLFVFMEHQVLQGLKLVVELILGEHMLAIVMHGGLNNALIEVRLNLSVAWEMRVEKTRNEIACLPVPLAKLCIFELFNTILVPGKEKGKMMKRCDTITFPMRYREETALCGR